MEKEDGRTHRNSVSKWCQNYAKHGSKGLESKTRGRARGQNRTLTSTQEDEIQGLLIDKTPDQFKLVLALWNRHAVQELIQMRFSIKMPIRTVGEYLMRWGLTPQKPLKQAYEQRPEAVRHG